jgi:hypothetical protein
MPELQTVVELPEFRRRATRLLRESEVMDLVYYLANNPEAGAVIRGSGGVRKVRWAREGRGKSGGVRVITFYTGIDMPLFLLTVYGKGARENLEKSEVAAMRELTTALKASYGRKESRP